MYSCLFTNIVTGNVTENLGLPLLRGNPFDLRPIESGRAEYLVGRDRLIASWREHIISQSPRMLLLVGERGSGRSSVVRTLASQTRRSFVGQYWPTSDPVNAIIHELAIHFCGFSSSGSNQKMIDDLVSNLEESTGSLPVISLDYPSNIEISMVLNSISPILQRLRALVIVVLTPSQLSSIDEETLELYDRPEYTTLLSKEQIQELSNRLVSRKAREKWIIDDILLSRIHESTSGNPRDVIRLLRDLIDERRDVGAHGALERLMRWKITNDSGDVNEKDAKKQILFSDESQDNIAEEDNQLSVDEPFENQDFKSQSTHSDGDESIQDVTKYIEDRGDDLPGNDLEENHFNFQTETGESQVNEEDFSEDPDDLWDDNSDTDVEEIPVESNTEQGTLDDFVYMQPGTEPPMFHSGSGFKGLAQRSKLAQSQQPNEEEDTPIIESVSEISHLWEGNKIDIESNQPENNIPTLVISSLSGKSKILNSQKKKPPVSFLPTPLTGQWSPSMASSLPVFENPETEIIETPFGIEDAPVQPVDIIENKPENTHRENFRPTTSWEPDNPFDEERITYLNEAELLVISMASEREISPSDAELQARLEVGRPRLSQIYNGLYKSGYLSVRKQGRKRLFKITEAAQKLVEA